MKKVLKEAKALRLLLLSVFLVSFFAMPVFAVCQKQQGVVANLVTDKTSYEADETITTTVTVTNYGPPAPPPPPTPPPPKIPMKIP